jgi:NAD-dependent deacetylase
MMQQLSLPEELTERLATVRSVGVITGAGVSAESGIQTYRGKGGIYDDPVEGERTVEAVSGPTLRVDPDRTWRAISRMVRMAGAAKPNRGHYSLAAIEAKVERFVLLTQNVDGLHQLAGSRNIIDIHGNIFETKCMSCRESGRLERYAVVQFDRAPRCSSCNGIIRPDVVLFEEMLPVEKVDRIRLEFAHRIPDLVMAVGTTALFPYITQPVLIAGQAGKLTVEINPESTMLSDYVDYSLRGPAGSYLPLIEDALKGN